MFVGGLFFCIKPLKKFMPNWKAKKPGQAKRKHGRCFFGAVMSQIILIDMIFSFDSIITAVGMAQHVEIMMIAVVIAMFIMFFLC